MQEGGNKLLQEKEEQVCSRLLEIWGCWLCLQNQWNFFQHMRKATNSSKALAGMRINRYEWQYLQKEVLSSMFCVLVSANRFNRMIQFLLS